MAFTPDQPFPKTPGNPIMAKDWNDSIAEVQRLDTAKVNRTGADAMAGPLTINNALQVGTNLAAAAGVRLHVVDAVTPAVARVQSTASFGAARLELWSDPRNSANEWRPGFIESFDLGTFTGGLRFVTNGSGAAAKLGAAEQMRLVNGQAGFGVTDPAFRIDALGPIRVRQFGGITPGVWLSGTAATNRAFLGLVNENSVGIMGAVAGWALQADVNTANVGIKVAPGATNALTVSGSSFLNGNAGVGVDAPTTPASLKFDVAGRARFRDASGLMAAIQLFNTASSAPQDRALVGLQSDTNVGFFGNTGGGWGLLMNTTTGAVTAGVSLYGERVWSNNVHTEVNATTLISYVGSTNNVYVQVPNMLITFTLATVRPVWFYFHLPGVEMGSINSWTVGFRLTLDGNEIVGTEPVLNHTDYHQRTVTLSKLVSFVAAGIHTVRAEWWVSSNGVTMFGCRSGGGGSAGARLLQVIEL